MISLKRSRIFFIAVVATTFILRVPLAIEHIRFTPDSVSYFNIAHNLATHQGFISTLKLHYPDAMGVRHNGLLDWPPLYPLFASTFILYGGNILTLQIVNMLLISIAAGIVLLIGIKLFNLRTGIVAGTFAAIAPNLFRAGSVAMSDALALVLVLTAILLVVTENNSAIMWLMAGVFAGAAAITKYPNIAIGIIIIIYALISRETRRYTAFFGIGFVCILAPVLFFQWQCRGSLMQTAQSLHYGVASFHDAMWDTSIKANPYYALQHFDTICWILLDNACFFVLDLLIGLRGLFLLSVGLIIRIIYRTNCPLSKEHKLVLTISILNFAVYALTWSIPPVKGSRFMLLSYCLILPFCAEGLMKMIDHKKPMIKLVAITSCTLTVAVYVWGSYTAAYYTEGECIPLKSSISSRILHSLPQGTNIASNNPWVINCSTGVPTALLPRNLDKEGLDRYVSDLNIGEIVLFGMHPHSKTSYTARMRYTSKFTQPRLLIIQTRS